MGSVSVGGCGNGIQEKTIPLAGPKEIIDLCEPMWEFFKVPIKRREFVAVQAHGLGAVTGQGWDGNQDVGTVGAKNEGILLSRNFHNIRRLIWKMQK